MSEPINFVEDRWHYLSPFSAHEVEIDGVVYKTAEHAYQALRMVPEVREQILQTSSPLEAWRIAQTLKEGGKLDPAHDKDVLMERIFRAKLAQHPDIREILLESGDRELLKVYPTDYYWGTGEDGTGENKMGKLWMKLRDDLRVNPNT
ncbi:MAG: NADAR family protein [Candidatus Paceibacterota bacterium]